MAKQSAVNTKQVQKLKEKAKLAAEKRLKLVRKAQLKAIKQVEKDEKFLIKLSNNRRLLKAAHSISDIKLVGRTANQAFISYSPTTISGSIASGDSSSIGNFINNYKLQKELMNHKARFGNQLINFKNKTSISSSDSAYAASSISSTSGYLSSSSNASNIFNSAANQPSRQPKYSDLVALNSSDIKTALSTSGPQRISLKSGSTVEARLRAVGSGVSRKVQLRRMLQGSSSDLTSSMVDELLQVEKLDSDKKGGNKLCNVQPAIKLKLNSDTQQNKPETGTGSKNAESNAIKWPPAPTMTRAVSEPDFGAALRLKKSKEEEEEDDDGEVDEQDEDDIGKRNPTFGSSESIEETKNGRIKRTCEKQSVTFSTASESNQKDNPGCGRDESQNRLLTRCLSQLKLRHEEITKRQTEEGELIKSNPSAPANSRQPQLAIFAGSNNSSDELIQHQLTAGQFPIRPSTIKQHQQGGKMQLIHSMPTNGNGQTNKSAASVSDSIGSASSLAQRDMKFTESSESDSAKSSSVYSQYSSTNLSTDSANCPKKVQHSNVNYLPVIQDLDAQQMRLDNDRQLENGEGGDGENIDSFLVANCLQDLTDVFEKERIDLDALFLLTEEDLKSLNILLGPRRKLMKAIEERKRLAAVMRPMFVMVDTSL